MIGNINHVTWEMIKARGPNWNPERGGTSEVCEHQNYTELDANLCTQLVRRCTCLRYRATAFIKFPPRPTDQKIQSYRAGTEQGWPSKRELSGPPCPPAHQRDPCGEGLVQFLQPRPQPGSLCESEGGAVQGGQACPAGVGASPHRGESTGWAVQRSEGVGLILRLSGPQFPHHTP